MSAGPILSGSELTEEITELREGVLTYTPGNVSTCADKIEFPKQLYIGLFGRTGCGKTSLINSLKFAVHGKLRRSQWLHAAGQEKAGGHIMYRKLANITENIFVVDNRGPDHPNTENAIKELAAQLDGKRGYSEYIKWRRANDDEGLDLIDHDFHFGHPIDCAVFVFSPLHEIDISATRLGDVIDFLHSHQGRYPVAIITHVDVAEKNHVEDLKTVLRVSGVSEIFEVANLTTEKKLLEDAYQHSLLSLLERCMTDGDETLIFKHYQRKEQQRKKEIEKRREEKRRKQEERMAEECRQMAKKERIERENQMRRKLEEQRRAIEREREQAEKQARERQEQERERRYQEAIARVEAEKQAEIRRIMNAKRKIADCEIM